MNAIALKSTTVKRTYSLALLHSAGILLLALLKAGDARAQLPPAPPPTPPDAPAEAADPTEPASGAGAEAGAAADGAPVEASGAEPDPVVNEATPKQTESTAKLASQRAAETAGQADRPAREERFSLMLHADLVWHTDRGFDLLSNDDVAPRLGVSLSMDVLKLSNELTLALGLEYSVEELDGGVPIPAFLETAELSAQHLAVTPTVRYSVFPWLSPHLRALGGVSFVETTVNYSSRGDQKNDSASPHFGAAAGVLVSFRPASGVLAQTRIGAVVEGGYVVGSPVQIGLEGEPAGTEPGEGRRIEVLGTELGEVGRGGPFVRIAAAIRF
jgi:hypothetical protein